MMRHGRNRIVPPGDPLPLQADEHHSVLVPNCVNRGPVHVIPYGVGVGLRIGGEASLCFRCGPDGGVFHPDELLSMADVLTEAERLAPHVPDHLR